MMVSKKKNPLLVWRWDKEIGDPREGCFFLSHPQTHDGFLFLANLSLKTSCSIGKTPCGISLSHPRDLLIPSTWPAYPIHVTSNYNNLGCFQSIVRLNIILKSQNGNI